MYIRRTISILAAALSIGVCVFITYISRDVDQSTILFNLIFLGVMLLMVSAACIVCLRRLIQDCRGLKDAAAAIKNGNGEDFFTADGQTILFQNEFLDGCYQQYCRMLKSNPNTTCDIQSFINEEVIETHAHRGILEMIPDILTSLGILGTFVGLVMGLREFDPSGYAQMAGSITPLINGIKVAFITSIYGIALSLAFSFNLRSEFSHLSDVMEDFLETFYLNVRPPYEVDSLSRILDKQKSQEEMQQEMTSLFVHQMVQSFEQVVTPAFNRMTDGMNHMVESFTENQANAVAQICEAVVSEMRSGLDSDFKQIAQTITELEQIHQNYSEFMEQSMNRMQKTFQDMEQHLLQVNTQSEQNLRQTNLQTQQALQQLNAHSQQSLQQLNASQEEAMRIAQEQKATYQEYIRFMYQSIDKFSEVWEKNGQKMQEYSDEIAKLGPVQFNRELKDQLGQVAFRLHNIEKQQHAAMMESDYSMDEDIADMLRNTLRKLDDLEEIVSTPSLFRSRRKKNER